MLLFVGEVSLMSKHFRTLARLVIPILGVVLLAGCSPPAASPESPPGPAPPPTDCPVFDQIALPTFDVELSQCMEPASSQKLQVTVSILPQKYFVERIGGEYVDVNVMVLPGESPATYEPKPNQLKALSQAAAYVSIGVPFEDTWMDRIAAANPGMMIVDTTAGIERMPMGSGEENLDPHIWLSPRLVKIQARTIYDALAQIDCAHQPEYQANLERFTADIDKLDTDIRNMLDGMPNRKFMVFHPSWSYFACEYGLEMIPIEVGGQEPSAAELAALATRARNEGITVVFAQPEFSIRDAETIAQEVGGKVLLISPLGSDWLNNMRSVAKTFADAPGQ